MPSLLDASCNSQHLIGVPVLHIDGIRGQHDNEDICGEYLYVGLSLGRAAYHLAGSVSTLLLWNPNFLAWQISRSGFHSVDAVAWAKDDPDPIGGIWYVWSANEQQFVLEFKLRCLPPTSSD